MNWSNMETLDINYYDKFWGEEYPARVVGFKDPNIVDNLIDPDKLITPSKDIKIRFDYPLSRPVVLSFSNPDGFTRKQLFEAIYAGYKHIYDLEDDPGYIEGTFNRASSEGPYGIWGHYMDDLFIEGVLKKTDSYFALVMGS